ncbi:MAG: 4Fe-4S dicluster domain-containing protein [Spirochaetia bacterium]|nr:4Fe-4S dicluster domain-containing protein [Spirochaetia bacterium]
MVKNKKLVTNKTILNKLENSINRKKFLTAMGITAGSASLNCVRAPIEKIVPYVVRPPHVQPGIPTYYASSRVQSEGINPVLVKTRDGKPIKIEGLDDHPFSKGAVMGDTYATIWDLYDADRFKTPLKKGGGTYTAAKWDDAITQAKSLLTGNVRVISRTSYSPSESSVLKKFLNRYNAKHIVYDPIGAQQELATGNEKSYGKGLIPRYAFDKADLIVSIEADFLGTWIRPDVFTKQFSSRRNPDKNMNRLVVAESIMSLTGANADTRLAIAAGTHVTFALGLAKELLPGSMLSGSTDINKVVSAYTPDVVEKVTGVPASNLQSLAAELKAAKGRSMVVGGGATSRDSSVGALQVVINLINDILDNNGKTIFTSAAIKETNDFSSQEELMALIAEMKAGQVDALVVNRANPVYDLSMAGFGDAVKKVKNVIFIGEKHNDTSIAANLILSSSHYLESWSDGETMGVYSVCQPVIRNLFDTKSPGDILLALAGEEGDFHSFVKQAASKYLGSTGAKAWDKLLADGYFVYQKEANQGFSRINPSSISSVKAPSAALKGYRLNLITSVGIMDGVNGNNAYRQEMPDPITKVTWDNVLMVSPVLAKEQGWKTGDIIELKGQNAKVEVPLVIQPGLRKESMGLAMGYGQYNMSNFSEHLVKGSLKKGELGVNAGLFAQVAATGYLYSGISVTATKVDKEYRLGEAQKELSQHNRYLARVADLKDYKKDPKSGHFEHKLEGKGMYVRHPHTGNRWLLNIDLNKCTGCSGCVVSCYSENNIPTVGREEIWRGREMSWIRLDRYYDYSSEKEKEKDVNMLEPNVHFQPLTCQHCEQAPCENVCPVAATQHSSDGLNEMAYNRCIGTRYCANNCPYKVRRFNWFENWGKKLKDPQQYALNPDVTVRSRGVIEKCSFCIQRIAEKRQEARVENRKISEEDLRTACQQGCPADAITFGDVNDAKTKVSQLEKDARSYKIIQEVNTMPMVTFMSKVKNKA